MRIINEISHPQCKITVFYWNNKYLVKFERGLIEQTYKLPEEEIMREEDVEKEVINKLIDKVMARFDDMDHDLMEIIDGLYL